MLLIVSGVFPRVEIPPNWIRRKLRRAFRRRQRPVAPVHSHVTIETSGLSEPKLMVKPPTATRWLTIASGTNMTRAVISEAAEFTALVAGAFVVRNSLLIGGMASFLFLGCFSG
jgi:hypothetical protein